MLASRARCASLRVELDAQGPCVPLGDSQRMEGAASAGPEEGCKPAARASWMAVRSPSSILSNSSMQQMPLSASTSAPPSSTCAPPRVLRHGPVRLPVCSQPARLQCLRPAPCAAWCRHWAACRAACISPVHRPQGSALAATPSSACAAELQGLRRRRRMLAGIAERRNLACVHQHTAPPCQQPQRHHPPYTLQSFIPCALPSSSERSSWGPGLGAAPSRR